MEGWQESLKKARQQYDIADHMAYVSFVILKEKRLMIKIVNEMYNSVISLIKAMLVFEAEKRRIRLSSDSSVNFKTFRERVAGVYLNKTELNNILNIMQLEKEHKQSEMEFVKQEKFVILNGEKYETLTIDKLKEMLSTLKGSLNKISGIMSS